MFLIVFYFILLSFQHFEVSGSESRIIGGDKAPPEFGWFHASLQNINGNHVCGGAVVSKWHVVTAGHCVKGALAQFIKIMVGTNNLDHGGNKYDAASINIYRDFNFSSRNNDIAIVTIKGEFDLQYVQIIKLDEKDLQEGDKVILTGFGAVEPYGESSREMYALILPVFNQEICKFAMRYSKDVTNNMFCTFTRIGEGTCHGDSGSPLIKGGKLVGLVSWGIPCASGFPDVHTRITPYIGWIKRLVRNHYCKTKLRAVHFPVPARQIEIRAD